MRYHIVGIAGAGMSAIAHLLLDQKNVVTGSDLNTNRLTATLAERGAIIHPGHDPAYVAHADALIATSAVRSDHPELEAARAAGIPLLKRSDLWRDWSQQRPIIAIAGTHGKTTTTAMTALILTRAGLAPGFLIGSEAPDLGGNAQWGDPTAPLVIEADEYDYAFLALTPQIAVITNIEWDHPDIFPTAEAYTAAFEHFAGQTQNALLINDETHISHESVSARMLLYGFADESDYQARMIRNAQFEIRGAALKDRFAACTLVTPGMHNVRNALAAIAVADQLGISPHIAAAALGEFRGTARRFEMKGEAGGITVIDDYAHHPTETRATLAAARARYTGRRIVVYVQPHTYSRTTALFEQWPTAFVNADVVLIGDIYAARETGDPAALAQRLAERIAEIHPDVTYAGALDQATMMTQERIRSGDVLLTLGAGDSYRIGERILDRLRHMTV